MSAKDELDAVLAMVNAELADPCTAYSPSNVPSPRPDEHVTVVIARRAGGEQRQCGGTGAIGYRITLRAVSRTDDGNVLNSLEACRRALEFRRITAGGKTSTPVQFETERPVAQEGEGGWFVGVLNLTYRTNRDIQEP